MGLNLSSAEHATLTALGEIYPQKIHLRQLAAKILPPLEHGALLQAVEGLHSRRLIEYKPLKGAGGLEDAANILLSSEGARWLQVNGHQQRVACCRQGIQRPDFFTLGCECRARCGGERNPGMEHQSP